MEQIVYTLKRTDEPIYAYFKTRVAAAIIDAIILAPITYGLMYYVLIYVKSLVFSLIISTAAMLYKCIMEKKYGATFGKKIMRISVVSENLQKLTYQQALIRNYSYFLMLIMAFAGHYVLYGTQEFQSATSLNEVWKLKLNMPVSHKIIRYLLSALVVIDSLFMLKNSRNQTLHDQLGKTLVIKN